MALIIEDGTGKTDAESYISVSDADSYVSKWHGTLSAWDDLDEAAKERALRMATRFIDAHSFKGYRSNEDQALDWPRIVPDWIDGQWIDSDEVPQAVKSATVEAAVRDAQGETLFPDHDGSTVKAESQKIGPMSKSFEYQGAKRQQKVFEVIQRLLEPYVVRSDKVMRGIG